MSIASTMALAQVGGHGSILVLGSDDDDNQSRDATFCLDEQFGTCAFGAASNSLRPSLHNKKRKSFTLDDKSTTGSVYRQSIYGKSGDIMQRTASTPSLPLRRSDSSPPSTPYYSHSLHSTPTNSAPGTPVQMPTDALSCSLLTPTLLSTPSDLNLPKSRLSSPSLSSLSDTSTTTATTTATTTQRMGGIIGTIRQQIAYQNLQADLSTSSPILLSAFEPWEKALLHSLLALSLTLLLYAAFAPDHDDGVDFMSKFNTAHF